jgi:trans-aconitate methyltransferase
MIEFIVLGSNVGKTIFLQIMRENDMNNIRAASFDNIANIYEKARPGYPQEVYEEIERHITFFPDTKILEVGAGDGKATFEMNQRWRSQITAIEPGTSLYGLLQKKTRGNNNVKTIKTTFEVFSSEELFDCVIAASAFHWVSKETGYIKSANLLKENGLIALFWNNFSRNDDAIFDEIQEIYRIYYPEDVYEQDIRGTQRKKTDERRKELEDSRCFRLISHREYIYSKTYTAKGYVELLNTFSDNSTKDMDSLSAFYNNIENLIKKNGDRLELPIHVNLEIGKKIA